MSELRQGGRGADDRRPLDHGRAESAADRRRLLGHLIVTLVLAALAAIAIWLLLS
jgi:hypothetical protein